MKNILVCLHLAVGEEDLIIEEDHMEEGAGMLVDLEQVERFHQVLARNGLMP